MFTLDSVVEVVRAIRFNTKRPMVIPAQTIVKIVEFHAGGWVTVRTKFGEIRILESDLRIVGPVAK